MAPKRSKNQIRRERAKLRKVEPHTEIAKEENAVVDKVSEKLVSIDPPAKQTDVKETKEEQPASAEEKQIEAKATVVKTEPVFDDSLMSQFADVFDKFQDAAQEEQAVQTTVRPKETTNDSSSASASESESESDYEVEAPLSKRQLRKRNRIPIADLKAATNKPQVVEWFDVDAPDPYLVVKLKTMPNAVDVPSHWQQKKEYLSAKRGMDRPPFQLPKFIKDTGIAEMRNHEPEALKKLQRDRVQPKMGKLDIDYQKLHDAFFKHQTKPRLLGFGQLYYEGREKNDEHRSEIAHVRPGVVSKALRAAVGMSENDKSIPPWITLMAELGKPPAFMNCIIPGVDVEYNNLGYKLTSENSGSMDMLQTWGTLENGEDSAEELELEELEEEEEEVNEEEIEPRKESDTENEPTKVDITEYSRIKTTAAGPEHIIQTLGALYTVLKERLGEAKDGYEITGKDEEEEITQEETKPVTDINPEDFKF